MPLDVSGQADAFRPKQIYEQVAEQIRSEIRKGRFAPMQRLPSERDLSVQFQTSRPAVREAIGALQNEGLVVTRPGSGTYVTEQAPALLAETGEAQPATADFSPVATLEVRLLLEPAIARLAARRAQRDPLAERYLAQMGEIRDITDPHQQALWSECDRLFHRQLAVMTQDALLIRIADEVAASMDQLLWQRLRDDGIYDAARIQLYVAEHRLIYEAVVQGNEDAAAFYVEQHIKRVQRDITSG